MSMPAVIAGPAVVEQARPTLWDFVACPRRAVLVPADRVDRKHRETAPPPRKAQTDHGRDDYLWEVYQRAPASGIGSDFTWKDRPPQNVSASRARLRDHGMGADFREQLYCQQGDGCGRHPLGDLERVRDDYRQASPQASRPAPQLAAYGCPDRRVRRGRAVDVTSEDGVQRRSGNGSWRQIRNTGRCRRRPAHVRRRRLEQDRAGVAENRVRTAGRCASATKTAAAKADVAKA